MAHRDGLYRPAGFALPTILIASLVMLGVMLMTVQAGASTSVALNSQYYNKLASEASESGAAMAQACLAANSYVATWTNAKPLAPNTDCYGNIQPGDSANIMDDPTLHIQTTFRVPAPTVSNGSQLISVNGSINLLRTSTNVVWKSISQSTAAQVGAQESFANVAFGYIYSSSNPAASGAYFATKDANGAVLTTGANNQGQLGNSTTQDSLTPTKFILPSGVVAQRIFTGFLSQGYTMFVAASDGNLYGAGTNDYGQLGNGLTAPTQPTPVRFTLPAGVAANYVGILRWGTYVIGSDNNVYATGACRNGLLGNGYTISACTDRSSAVRVNLPAVNLSDSNTLPALSDGSMPATNMAMDSQTIILRMQGGRVYGWGSNNEGQLATGDTNDSSNPVKVGSYGDSGQPKATQVAFDGETTYVLDDSGKVMASGHNNYGQLAGGAGPLVHSSGMCLENPGNSASPSTSLRLYTCNNSTAQQITFASDGTLQFHPNSTTTLCVDNANGVAANGNPVGTWTCNGNVAQQWNLLQNGSIYNPASGMCIDDPGNSQTVGVNVRLYTCNGTAAQTYAPGNRLSLSQVQLPSTDANGVSLGNVTKIATDQWSILFLTSSGEVWGSGLNDMGQLGNGATANINMRPLQMTLPSGRKAVDIYTTKAASVNSPYANTFVILDDGSVWGCGGNSFGQLGDGTTTDRPAPVKMNLPSGEKAKQVESGFGTTVILTTNGKIYTVGNNSNGQLGDGTTTNSSTPKANPYTNILPVRTF